MSMFMQVGTFLTVAALTVTGAAAQATYKKIGSEAGWDIYVNEEHKRLPDGKGRRHG